MKRLYFAAFLLLLAPFVASAAPYAPAVGGTGTSTPPHYGQVLVGNAAGTYTLTATTSLGISSFSTTSAAYWLTTKSTTNLTEGSNLYWTDIRFDSRLAATTTLPNITTLANLTTVKTSLSGILKASSGVLAVASPGTDYQAPLTAGTDYVQPSRAINTTYPLQGGGNLSADRTLTLALATTSTNTWVHQIFASLFATSASSTNATTTSLYVTSVTNGLHAGDGVGKTYSAATSSVTAGTAISTSGNGAIVGSGLTINFAAPLSAPLSIPYASTTAVSATTICITTDCRTAWPTTGASSTLLSDANTFSGVDLFTNSSSNFSGTWQTFSPSHFLTSAITTLGDQYHTGLTGATQTFATSSDTNIGLTIVSSGAQHLFTPTWIGTLADARITSAATWNAKQAAISVTWPITLTSATVGFNGLSTTTAAVVGNVPYFSGVNTFANEATGTVSAGSSAITVTANRYVLNGSLSIDCATASGSQNGCLSSTDWSTFNSKSSAAYPFTSNSTGIFWNQISVSTTTQVHFGATGVSLSASSTSQFDYSSTTSATFGTASTTNLTVASVRSVIPLMGATGLMGAYGGSGACTNQFVTVLSAAGAGTCASVTDSTFSGQLGVAHGGTGDATFTSSQLLYGNATNALSSVATTSVTAGTGMSFTTFTAIGASPITITNTGATFGYDWTSNPPATFFNQASNSTTTQIHFGATGFSLTASSTAVFNSASSTALSASSALFIPSSASQAPTYGGQVALDTTNDQLVAGDGSVTSVFDKRRFLTENYATTTTWTGSTTLPAIPVPAGMTFNTIQCFTNTGTLNVQVQYGSAGNASTFPTMLNASTTMGLFNWTTNNTPPLAATTTVTFGTPASSPTSIGCTISGTVTGT